MYKVLLDTFTVLACNITQKHEVLCLQPVDKLDASQRISDQTCKDKLIKSLHIQLKLKFNSLSFIVDCKLLT